jgi:hypothetical protein
MGRYTIMLPSHGQSGEAECALSSPTIGLAMIVADINLTSGSAEIWDGTKRIARVEKQTASGASFWKVD